MAGWAGFADTTYATSLRLAQPYGVNSLFDVDLRRSAILPSSTVIERLDLYAELYEGALRSIIVLRALVVFDKHFVEADRLVLIA